jgi:hypothetical protein
MMHQACYSINGVDRIGVDHAQAVSDASLRSKVTSAGTLEKQQGAIIAFIHPLNDSLVLWSSC